MDPERLTYLKERVDPLLETLATELVIEPADDPAERAVNIILMKHHKRFGFSKEELNDFAIIAVLHELRRRRVDEETYKDLLHTAKQLHGEQARRILELEETVEDMTEEVQRLELENFRLKGMLGSSCDIEASPGGDDSCHSSCASTSSCDNAPLPPQRVFRRRFSVSAETYGSGERPEYKSVWFPKSPEQTEVLQEAIKNPQAFFFRDLTAAGARALVDAMSIEEVPRGTVLIRQGDPGEAMYIVVSGAFICEKKVKDRTQELRRYDEGGFFGELAILYSEPRQASLTATEE